jgi:large subunit ribosomal protein L31e
MAEKKAESKIVLEREYNIPLRRKFSSSPKYKRAKKAVKTVIEFMSKHMKSKDIKIGPYLNQNLWKDGIKNPPHHVMVIARKDDQGVVHVELKSAPAKKQEKKKELKKDNSKTEDKAQKSDDKKTDKQDSSSEKTETNKQDKVEKTQKPDKQIKTDEKAEEKPSKTEELKKVKTQTPAKKENAPEVKNK